MINKKEARLKKIMLFHIKDMIRNVIFRLFAVSKNELTKFADIAFSPVGYTQNHITNTTIITMFEKNGDVRFFRECRKHNDLKTYVFDAIHDYFDRVSAFPQAEELKKAVVEDLDDPSNYKRLIRVGGIFNAYLLEILCNKYEDYSAVGVPGFGRFQAQNEFASFIKYMSGIVSSQKTNAYLKKGAYENFSANKQLATYRLACMLGVEELITPVHVCGFLDGDAYRLGTLMDKAPGYPPSEILPEERKNLEQATFLKDITNLEYLDALCYQLDHRLDNYYVVENGAGRIAHVVTFDNDAARTFFVSGKLPKGTYAGCSCVVSKDGKIARPYMDSAFAEHLRRLDKVFLKRELGELMSGMQLRCLWKRIRALQKAVEKTAAENGEFLVADWAAAAPEKEEDSSYGCTYYKLYLTDTLMLDREKLFEEMKEQQN